MKTTYFGQIIRKSVGMIDPKAEIILYGSRARGDERIYSDWDILTRLIYNRKKIQRETV